MGVSPPQINAQDARANLFLVRRLTGFSWEELALLARVTRRTMHNWAQGAPITPANRKHLANVAEAIAYIDRGSSSQNRIALGEANSRSVTVMQALSRQQYALAKRIAGGGNGGMTHAHPPLDEAEMRRIGPLGIGFFDEDSKP